MKFSKQTGNFYPEDINYHSLPADLIEVSKEDFDAAMARQPGDTVDVVNGRVVVIPKPAQTTEEIKARKWDAIKSERDRRTENGGFKVGAKWFHSDQKSRSQQLGLVLLGANIPAGLQWKTMDGSFVTMTQTLAQQILGAGAASDQAIFTAAETHRATMEASADPSAYDFSGGWPATFAG
jgi:hypothetical protein